MFRVTTTDLDAILMVLWAFWTRHPSETDTLNLVSSSPNVKNLDTPARSVMENLHYALRRGSKRSENILSLLNRLGEQVYDAQNFGMSNIGEQEKNLIDNIVEICQLNTANAHLGGSTISQLREALLTPSELGALNRTLRSHQMYCHRCKSPIRAGESMTPVDSDGDFVFFCGRCFRPDYVKCSHEGCEERILVGKETKFWDVHCCPTHATSSTKKEKKVVRTTQQEDRETQLRAMETFRDRQAPTLRTVSWDALTANRGRLGAAPQINFDTEAGGVDEVQRRDE